MATPYRRPHSPAANAAAYGRKPPKRSRLLLILLPALAIFIGFASIVWLAYVEGAPASAVGEPPLIRADARPIKMEPDDPGGQSIPDRGELGSILADDAPPGEERLMPLPEEPLTAPPDDEAPADAPSATELAAAADAIDDRIEADPPAPAGAGEGTDENADVGAGESPLLDDEPPAETAAAIESLFREDDPAPGGQPAAPAAGAAAPSTEAQPAAAPSTSPPVESTETRLARSDDRPPAILNGSGEQRTTPAVAPSGREVVARPSPETAPAAPSAPTAGAPDLEEPHYRIQLAAVRNESDARRAWDLFQVDLGEVLGGIEPIIERGETSNGVFYRVQLGPYPSLERADALCEELKQRNASCFVLRR